MSTEGRGVRRRSTGACLLAACMGAITLVNPPPFRKAEEVCRDAAQRLVPPVRSEETCVIAAADGKGRREIGPWPWPDETAARLVERISRGHPRAIGIVSCPASADGSAKLAGAVRGAGNAAAGFELAFGSSPGPAESPLPEGARIRYVTNPWGKARGYRMPEAGGASCVELPLAEAAAASGFSNHPPPREGEGVVRAAPLVAARGDAYLMSLPVALASVAWKTNRVTLRLKGDSVDGVEFDERLIPSDARGMLRLRASAGSAIPVISASDILLGNADPSRWAGKVVLVGECAERMPALVRGRFPSGSPPVVLDACAVGALLRGEWLDRSRPTTLVELALAVLFPFLACGIFTRPRRRPAKWGLLAAVLAGCAGGAALAMAAWGEEARPFYPALSAVISWAVFGARGLRRGGAGSIPPPQPSPARGEGE